MASHTAEVITGGVVLVGAVGFFLYASQIAGFSGAQSKVFPLAPMFDWPA